MSPNSATARRGPAARRPGTPLPHPGLPLYECETESETYVTLDEHFDREIARLTAYRDRLLDLHAQGLINEQIARVTDQRKSTLAPE